jgi:hypothetical protein
MIKVIFIPQHPSQGIGLNNEELGFSLADFPIIAKVVSFSNVGAPLGAINRG